MREHLEFIAKQPNAVRPKQLDKAKPPSVVADVWLLYHELNRNRTSGQAISYSDILAYSDLYGMKIKPTTVDLLRTMDVEYIKFMNNKHNQVLRQPDKK